MLRHACLFVLIAAGPIAAAPAEDHWTADPSPAFQEAVSLVETGRYADAAPLLEELAAAEPGNADVFNLLGFARRKAGDLDQAGAAYARALRLNPDHLGAIAYQGELFLKQDNLEQAEANLARLAVLCPSGCNPRFDLTVAVAAWKADQ